MNFFPPVQPPTERAVITPGYRSGVTLIELLVATGVSTLLLVGMGSAVRVSLTAFNHQTDAAAVEDLNHGLTRFQLDLNRATEITSRSATSVTVSVPDGGTGSDSLTYQYTAESDTLSLSKNEAIAEPIATGISAFTLTHADRDLESVYPTDLGAIDTSDWGTRWDEFRFVNIGNDSVFENEFSWRGKYITAWTVDIPEQGELDSISVYVDRNGTIWNPTIQIAIHKIDDGEADGLVVVSEAVTVTSSGWYTLPCSNVSLSPRSYFVSFSSNNSRASIRHNGSSSGDDESGGPKIYQTEDAENPIGSGNWPSQIEFDTSFTGDVSAYLSYIPDES